MDRWRRRFAREYVWFALALIAIGDGGAQNGRDRPDESAFFTRFQVAF
jgi:hypothetical protein